MEPKARKKSIVNVKIGESKMDRIPRVFEDIYKIDTAAVTDSESLSKDETVRMHTIRTITVETTTVAPSGNAVIVNGEHEISLGDEEQSLTEKTYNNLDEAVSAWKVLTVAQLEKARTIQQRVNEEVNFLETQLEKDQY